MPELKLQQTRLDGRYDILECLGRGSYAEIYVARDNGASEGAPTTVVIKALNMFLDDAPDRELEQTLIANFQNEAVALDRVRHPNIINRLGHGTAIDLVGTTFHYIVLEYLSGGDMAALSRRSALPLDKALFYLEQVCSGLAHAHDCGVIHRDIKPQNLLLTGDRQVVKIADFGVARFATSEGAITRVGTNIYSAPEHNPLVQTGSLDLGALASGSHGNLTPAADIYSLAKTTYTLLAGEAPRKFAQHAIQELPAAVSDRYWARSVLQVLEKATQIRPDQRYQSVQEFWDDLAEASLPPTKLLDAADLDARRRPSEDLAVQPEDVPAAPPKPRFEPVQTPTSRNKEAEATSSGSANWPVLEDAPPAQRPGATPHYGEVPPAPRPKIVVPVSALNPWANKTNKTNKTETVERRLSAKERITALPNESKNGKPMGRRPVTTRRLRPFLVAALLIVAFSGMLLATHKYVTSRWNPFVGISKLGDIFVIGREGVTTTDVKLRPDPSAANPQVGLAEAGSRVKVLSSDGNWYEVQVLQHGRPKRDPFTSDRGWLNKQFVKFD